MAVELAQGTRPPIVVVDYHKGNLQSMARGLKAAGAPVLVSDDPAAIDIAGGVVLPGVGAFADAIAFMALSGQADAIRRAIAKGVPFLGVCLGMQLLFERGREGAQGVGLEWVQGLGVLPGEVTRLPEAAGAKIPHVGWNQVDLTDAGQACPLFEGVRSGEYFYFTHSYACQPSDSHMVLATTTHAQPFVSAVWDGGCVYGTQFHPEKSSGAGSRVMANFARIVERAQGIDDPGDQVTQGVQEAQGGDR